MKPADQGIKPVSKLWVDMLPFALRDDLSLMVGNYRQRYPFHYVEKEWLSQDIITKLEKAARG
jgi:hypothetical protein